LSAYIKSYFIYFILFYRITKY